MLLPPVVERGLSGEVALPVPVHGVLVGLHLHDISGRRVERPPVAPPDHLKGPGAGFTGQVQVLIQVGRCQVQIGGVR